MKTRMWLLQLKVVLWKNLIIRKRHWLLTIFEALIPVTLFLLIAYGRSKITGLNKREITDVTYSEKIPIIYGSSGINLEETQLYYSPDNDFFADLIHRVQVKFQITNNNVQGFNTQDNLLEHYVKSNNKSVISIIFNSAKDSPQFDYTIRSHEQHFSWDTQQLFKSQLTFVPAIGSLYLWKGFLALQKALDMSFIEKMNGSETDIDIETLEFPYPPYKDDSGMSSIFIHYLPLITLFSFIFVCPAVLKRVVEEKYSGIKELMKMVGMRSWMLWLGWFIYSIIPMIVSVFLVILVMKVDLFGVSYPLIEHADAGVLIVFLILYCMAATVACFFISTLFKKPTLATLVGLLLWILTYFVPKYLLEGKNDVPLSWSYMLLLLPNMALHYGFTAVSYYEEREIGINWSNLHLPGGGGSNEVTMANVFLTLIFDIFFYMVLTLYFDSIMPGKYGVPKSVLFPFQGKGFKWFTQLFERNNNVETIDESENMYKGDVELGLGVKKGIELIKLTKKYGKKTVVRELSMDIYKDRITVLLGHNGAGKTTTMGMITGMIKKTRGTIKMDEKEIESSDDVTSSIGLCPQHNLFFPDLTVTEHLQFFAMLKGRSGVEAKKEITSLLKKLDLSHKANAMAHTLSGGMQRKLCLGMAVVGGSKILILDEPSSGMDPESRRHMWDLLLSWRNDKTILITTHFMEEADALGDWIAIMNQGSLRCYGTPMHLKKTFETGYNLNLHINKDGKDVQGAIEKIENAISEYRPKIKSINGSDVVFLLPFENNYVNMFQYLEANEKEFDIGNMSCTTTTLEDVFLNTNDSDKGKGDSTSTKGDGNNTKDSGKDKSDSNSDIASIRGSEDGYDYGLTFKALLFKRYRFIYWKLQTYLIPCGIALLFLLLCIYLGQGASDYTSNGGPALKMKLDSYGKTTVLFNGTSNDPTILKMKDFYGQMVTNEKSLFRVVDDVSQEIVKEGTDNLPYYKTHMVAAAEFTRKSHGLEAVAMYNNLAMHSAPISLNLITNTLAKAILGEQYSISMTSHPLDHINSDTTADQLSEVQIGLLWLIIMPLGFLFFLGSFIYFPYVELSTNFTELQFMCGCPPWLYWLITYLNDLIFYGCFAVVMSIITLAWTPFRGEDEFWALLSILAMYGVCGIPCAYLFGRRRSFSGAYALFIILGIMLGVMLTGIVSVLEESRDKQYIEVGNYLRQAFLVFCPQFGLTYNSFNFSRKVINNYNFEHMPRMKLLSECHREEPNPCCLGNGPACQAHQSYWSVIIPNFGFMAIGAVLFLLVNILIHNYSIREWINKLKKLKLNVKHVGRPYNSQTDDELDDSKMNTLKVSRLQKSYSNKKVVNDIDFTLKRGQCMGILGVNGAGKTTTFKMLTRAEIKDNGDITINKFDINQKEYLRKLGYCPQNDALNYSLTGREILQTMAWLRGINNPDVVESFLAAFELKDFADIPCEYYSGGNKRKLSFAVSVIGIPDVILLDEPTNGVDPSSKRKFWSLIKTIKNTCNNSFVLTSHSLTECEALCNDLKIMNDGVIKKTGTLAKLRDELNGFDVKMKLKQTDKEPAVKKPTDIIPQRSCDETDGDSMNEETIHSDDHELREIVTIKLSHAELKAEHPVSSLIDKVANEPQWPCNETDGSSISMNLCDENGSSISMNLCDENGSSISMNLCDENGSSISMNLCDENGSLISMNLCDENGSSISMNLCDEKLEPLDKLKNVVKKRYPHAELKDEHPGLLHYYIKTEKGVEKKWSHLFQRFEEIKKQFEELIEEYSISEASLEDVFLDVARENKINDNQNEPDTESKKLQS